MTRMRDGLVRLVEKRKRRLLVLPTSRRGLYKRWTNWLERIRQDIHTLAWDREVWRGFRETVEKSDHFRRTGGALEDWIARHYVAAMAVGVRRQLDTSGRSISLFRLLVELSSLP